MILLSQYMDTLKPSLYEYLDYRQYLRDLYTSLNKKEERRFFSLRYFSRAAGFSSPNYLKLVMDGARNLTQKSIRKFSRALKLDSEETEFFENLVYMNQSPSTEEKNHYYARLSQSQPYLEAKGLEKDQYEYFTQWYYAVIREMILMPHFRENPQWIADQLVPKITGREAAQAIELLVRLGLLRRDPQGRLEQAERNITSGEIVRHLALCNFHRSMMQRAQESIDAIPGEERDISAITIAIHTAKVPELKKKMAEFRKEVHALLGDEKGPNAVYQINFQVFRLTKISS